MNRIACGSVMHDVTPPVRDVLSQSNLVAEGVREAEPGVGQPEDRQPGAQLALQAMLQLLGSRGRQG